MSFNKKDEEKIIQKQLETLLSDFDVTIDNERHSTLKLYRPSVNFYITDVEFINSFKTQAPTVNLSIFISVSKKDYENGTSLLAEISDKVQELPYPVTAIDYDNFVKKFNSYTTLVQFKYLKTNNCNLE